MNRLQSYIRRHLLRYGVGILCTIATASLAMAIPFLIRDAINAIQAGHAARVMPLVEAIWGAAVLMGLARWLSRFIIFNTGRDIEYEMRRDLFAHLLQLDPAFYQSVRTGDLMSRLINDLTAVRMMVGIGVLSIINTPLYWIYALAIMLSFDVRLTVASITPYVALFVIMWRLSHALMERSLWVQEGLGAIGAKVQESLSGIHVVKAYNFEEHEVERFRLLNDDYNRQNLALARLRGALLPMIRAAAASSTMIVLIYGGWMVMGHQMSLGDLVAFISYLGLLAWPTTAFGWTISLYQRGKAAMHRIDDIFNIEPLATANGLAPKRLAVAGAIEWKNVSLTYHRDHHGNGTTPQYALNDVSVRVEPGQKLAIVGRTGAGKSTMVKLLTRLLEPTSGQVLLDGRPVGDYNLGDLRRTIGMVPQEPVLFSDTLARNIAFGRIDAPLETIVAAARTAGLEHDIVALPKGLETIVGERGMSLSGGQKQRVTIARLLTYDPAVVVLDDALSSVDTETERTVLSSLGETVRGRTTIVVSHRASTVRDADQIIVLEHGQIVERGTHEELMSRRGVYAALFRRQLLEEELARY
jgi:ATP-binding cassette subfamily B multidrug efflux pump